MTKKQQRYNFIAHAIRHGFSYREIGKMLGVHHSYVAKLYYTKPMPKLPAKKLCKTCAEILANLTESKK